MNKDWWAIFAKANTRFNMIFQYIEIDTTLQHKIYGHIESGNDIGDVVITIQEDISGD